MKHPSRWKNDFARRTVIVLATFTLYPIGLICAAGYGMWEVSKEWKGSCTKVWKRSNDVM